MRTPLLTAATLVVGAALAVAAYGRGPGPRGHALHRGVDRTPLAELLELTEDQQAAIETLRADYAEQRDGLAEEMKAAKDAVLTEAQRAVLEELRTGERPRGRHHRLGVDLDLSEAQVEQLQAIRERFGADLQALRASLEEAFVAVLTEEQAAALGERSVFGHGHGGRLVCRNGDGAGEPDEEETSATEDVDEALVAAKIVAATAVEETSWAGLKQLHGGTR